MKSKMKAERGADGYKGSSRHGERENSLLLHHAPIPKIFAEDLESEQEGTWKLQCALDACAAVDLMVKEAK